MSNAKTVADPHQAAVDQLMLGGSYTPEGYNRTLLDPRASAVSEGKKVMRRKVLDVILENCSFGSDKHLNMVSLPGPQWTLEHELFRRTDQRARFTAFEKTQLFMHRGLVNVPRLQEGQRIDTEWDAFEPAGIRYFRTSASRWVYMDFLDWCLLEADNMLRHNNPNFSAFSHWRNTFWGWDCMWLDFTSCLYPKMERALSRLPRLYSDDERDPVKPIAVTVQKGRETRETMSILRDLNISRTEYVVFLLDRKPGYLFELLEEFEYTVEDGVTMLNVIGRWKRQ
jgi:hypothetical protein